MGWIVALVQHSEHDVDGDQCRGDQQRLAGQRGLERLRRSLKAAVDAWSGSPMSALRLLDRVHRVAQARPGRQVERQRHRRETGPGG